MHLEEYNTYKTTFQVPFLSEPTLSIIPSSLSLAIFEFYSEDQATAEDNMLLKQYQYSVSMWKEFLSYGIQRGEFRPVDCEALIDIVIFSYQGVRMYSSIFPSCEPIAERVICHIKKALLC